MIGRKPENSSHQISTTQPMKATAELTGIDAYMEPKIKAAQLIEPGSVQEISAIGDKEDPWSRLVLVLDLLREYCGWTADQAAAFSDIYQQVFLFRWEHDAPPESLATPR